MRMASPAIPFKELRSLAKDATANEMLFVRGIDSYSDEELLTLFSRSKQALKDTTSTKNRRLLRRLVRVLRALTRAKGKERRASAQRRRQLQQLEDHRRELAKLPPWQLRIIGQTDVATYVTAQTNVRWAPKKKRRS